MRKRLLIVLIGILAVALGTGLVLARLPLQSSANYAIPWDVVSGGGNEMSSSSYGMKSTIGQGAIGPGVGSNFSIGAGYWYGTGQGGYELFLPFIERTAPP